MYFAAGQGRCGEISAVYQPNEFLHLVLTFIRSVGSGQTLDKISHFWKGANLNVLACIPIIGIL